MRVLLTGGTGLIGRALAPALVAEGHRVVVLTRDTASARKSITCPCEFVEGDLHRGPVGSPLLESLDAVVHLMGESVAEGRWTAEKKKRLVESRVLTTRHLRDGVRGVKRIVAASAIGFYGDAGDRELDETSAAGGDFLAGLCVQWENEVAAFRADGTRTVSLRTGLVLTRKGGALPPLLVPFRVGLGGPLGDGRSWMSWIHLDDVVGLYLRALHDETWEGAFNATAPHPVRNRELTQTLADLLHKPAVMRVPSFALKLALGERAEMITASAKVLPKRALSAGYRFKYSILRDALASEL